MMPDNYTHHTVVYSNWIQKCTIPVLLLHSVDRFVDVRTVVPRSEMFPALALHIVAVVVVLAVEKIVVDIGEMQEMPSRHHYEELLHLVLPVLPPPFEIFLSF